MLRIISSDAVPVTTIALDGKLLQPWVTEVSNAVSAVRAAGSVRLDLANLSFADESGLALLRDLRLTGVELTGANAFLRALLSR